MAKRFPLVRDEQGVEAYLDGDAVKPPYELRKFAEDAGIPVSEAVDLWEEHGLYDYGASGRTSKSVTVDTPGRVGASGSAHVTATIVTDGPVTVGASGRAKVVLSGNVSAVVDEGTSGDAVIEYE